MAFTEPIKRKFSQYAATSVSLSDDEETDLFYLVCYEKTNEYSIVEDRHITIDASNLDTGVVRHLGKKYAVEILKRGTREYVIEKAKKFALNLKIDTTDDEKTKRARNQSAIQSTPSIMDDNVIFESTCQSGEKNKKSPSYISKEEFQRYVQENEMKMKEVFEKFERNTTQPTREFIYNGKSLVDDFHGKNAVKWSLKVVDHLFTEDELRLNVLEQSNKTTRGTLDPARVKLLKEALVYKYKYGTEKTDKVWDTIRDRINNKGRNQKFKWLKSLVLTNRAD